jgi:glycosyltransferase involved in cell wall biosynthesis
MGTGRSDRAQAAGPASTFAKRLLITVAIPTCNRPDDIARCLGSLARIRYPNWQLLLVDQSDGEETRLAAIAWGALIPKIVYLRLKQKNASAARNLALESAAGDILAFIDDDCTVSPDWLDHVEEAFKDDPEANMIFGAVLAGDHDPDTAYLPSNVFRGRRRLRGSLALVRVRAMGASMSIRLGPATPFRFDLLLGPGSHFRASQDIDYALRVLAAGGIVVETPGIVVTHHGARSFAGAAARTKIYDYVYGIGACHIKLLRCGEWIMVATIAGWLVKSIARIRPHNVIRRRPTRFGGLVRYIRGLRDGFRTPIDRRTRVYGLPFADEEPQYAERRVGAGYPEALAAPSSRR